MSAEPAAGELDAIDFVRFCYRRRHVGWPELYDEMCAVAGRGLYHGYCAEDLSRIGIGFSLFEMPALATIVHSVVAEDQERRRLSAGALRTRYVATETATEPPPIAPPMDARVDPSPPAPERAADLTVETADIRPRLVVLPAGAM